MGLNILQLPRFSSRLVANVQKQPYVGEKYLNIAHRM